MADRGDSWLFGCVHVFLCFWVHLLICLLFINTTNTQTHKKTLIQTCIHAHSHTNMHTCIHVYSHTLTCTHTDIHTHTHTHWYAHMNTNALILPHTLILPHNARPSPVAPVCPRTRPTSSSEPRTPLCRTTRWAWSSLDATQQGEQPGKGGRGERRTEERAKQASSGWRKRWAVHGGRSKISQRWMRVQARQEREVVDEL